MKAIVIGAGVTGLSCAYGLARRGVDVTVLDSGRIGAGTSAGNAGWVTPFLSAPKAAPGAVRQAVRGSLHSGGPFDELTEHGVAFERHMSGLAIVAKTKAGYEQYRRLAALMVNDGYRGMVRCLRGAEVIDFKPAVRRDVFGIVHVLDDGHVGPETLTSGLTTQLRSGGASVHGRSSSDGAR
jgi:D-amino-acid dehydrogenase